MRRVHLEPEGVGPGGDLGNGDVAAPLARYVAEARNAGATAIVVEAEPADPELAAAVGATVAVTSAVVGSIVRAPPPGCVAVNYGGMVYQQCGATWYAPQGSQYIVVNPPY